VEKPVIPRANSKRKTAQNQKTTQNTSNLVEILKPSHPHKEQRKKFGVVSRFLICESKQSNACGTYAEQVF
jgi:hypothetical protein